MKKIVAIFLLVTYGVTSVGATIHIHYCMSKFVGWSLSDNKSEKCGRCGMESDKTKGCCKDEHKHIKLSTDQQSTSILFHYFFFPVILAYHYGYDFSQPTVALKFPKNNAPPPKHGILIYIRNQVFRI